MSQTFIWVLSARTGRQRYYTVSYDGFLRPCNRSSVILGNLRRRSFAELVTAGKAAAFWKPIPRACLKCSYPGHDLCRGGCPAASDNAQIKTSERAFGDYTGKTRKLIIGRTKTGLTLSSSQIGDNYVHMRIRVLTRSTDKRDNGSVDGGWLRADVVTDDDDKVLAKNVRVFYYLDSAPGDKLHASNPGDEIEILGMPRLDLDRILAVSQDKNVTVIPLPIEFIAVALIGGN